MSADSVKQPDREFDLQPHPRILPMLGEITLSATRCVAELVDNSIDGFLSATRNGQPISHAVVHVSLPTSQKATGIIKVRDNGPGMDPVTLANAIRAGWTSSNPIDNLGLFGMGFNIATARLGRRTKVWSTRTGDTEWYGLEIDFGTLIKQKHFKTTLTTRSKQDPGESGTEIIIEQLKPEQLRSISRQDTRAKIKKELSRIYSTMLREPGTPIGFGLHSNTDRLKPRTHCVWGSDGSDSRSVEHPQLGNISAFQHIDHRLDDRLFDTAELRWLGVEETEELEHSMLPSHIVSRERRIYGWVGVQRYLSESEYGIDLVRNGRKIELQSRDLFKWSAGEVEEDEYPIDDPRRRGRLVGEVHLDHCRVTYTKDRFDRDDPAWAQMLEAVRGRGPLRPDKARQQDFGPNASPLYQLFQAFRRSTPKPKVAGCYKRLLIVPDNDLATEMASRYDSGDPDYLPDSKWWELVEEADRALLKTDDDDDAPSGFDDDPDADEPTSSDESADDGTESESNPGADPGGNPSRPPSRTAIAKLTREYSEPFTGQKWDVHAFAVTSSDPGLPDSDAPWHLARAPSGVFEFLVIEHHRVFQSATLTALDALLIEIAVKAVDFARGGSSDPVVFSRVLATLRNNYGQPHSLEPATLLSEARSCMQAIGRSVASQVDASEAKALYDELPISVREAIQRSMASRSVNDPHEVVNDGRFLEYASTEVIRHFVSTHPELFFDGRYWQDRYETVEYESVDATEVARDRVVSAYDSLISDVSWLLEQEADDLLKSGRSRVLRAMLAIELLSSTEEPDVS